MSPDLQVIAALAGVIHHMEEGEIDVELPPMRSNGANAWALAGRQSIMRMGNLVQRRVLSR